MTKDEASAAYTKANAAHMADAAAIGAIYPRKDPALEAAFNASHEARRLAFLAWVAAR